MNEQKSVFATLSAIDCADHIEKKKTEWTDKMGVKHTSELSYLSWAWAWHICKEHYPNASYTIYEDAEGRPYFDDGRTCWVKTGVTIEGQEHIEYLPVMDYRNLSIPVDRVTSFDINKSIQRSLTKALARHGLALYVYAGEDLPWSTEEAEKAAELAKLEPAGTARKNAHKTGGKKADPAPAPEPAPEKAPIVPSPIDGLTRRQYDAVVKAAAEGRMSKSGIPARDAFINEVRPTPEQLDDFDAAVFEYRLDHNINLENEGGQAHA